MLGEPLITQGAVAGLPQSSAAQSERITRQAVRDDATALRSVGFHSWWPVARRRLIGDGQCEVDGGTVTVTVVPTATSVIVD